MFNRRLSQPIKPFDRAGAVDRNTIQRPFVDESSARQIVYPRCSSASSPPFPLFITQCPIVVLLFFLELRLIPTEKELGPKRKPAARNPVRIWCGHIESTKAIVIEATRTIQTNQINRKNKKKIFQKREKAHQTTPTVRDTRNRRTQWGKKKWDKYKGGECVERTRKKRAYFSFNQRKKKS